MNSPVDTLKVMRDDGGVVDDADWIAALDAAIAALSGGEAAPVAYRLESKEGHVRVIQFWADEPAPGIRERFTVTPLYTNPRAVSSSETSVSAATSMFAEGVRDAYEKGSDPNGQHCPKCRFTMSGVGYCVNCGELPGEGEFIGYIPARDAKPGRATVIYDSTDRIQALWATNNEAMAIYAGPPPTPRATAGMVLVRQEAIDWLNGESDFECPPDRYFCGEPPRYWWRSVFREKAGLSALPGDGSAQGGEWKPAEVGDRALGRNTAATTGQPGSAVQGECATLVDGIGDANPMFGRMIGANFTEDTITLQMEPGYYAASGRYAVRPAPPKEAK